MTASPETPGTETPGTESPRTGTPGTTTEHAIDTDAAVTAVIAGWNDETRDERDSGGTGGDRLGRRRRDRSQVDDVVGSADRAAQARLIRYTHPQDDRSSWRLGNDLELLDNLRHE